jgi:hypothetical protein
MGVISHHGGPHSPPQHGLCKIPWGRHHGACNSPEIPALEIWGIPRLDYFRGSCIPYVHPTPLTDQTNSVFHTLMSFKPKQTPCREETSPTSSHPFPGKAWGQRDIVAWQLRGKRSEVKGLCGGPGQPCPMGTRCGRHCLGQVDRRQHCVSGQRPG